MRAVRSIRAVPYELRFARFAALFALVLCVFCWAGFVLGVVRAALLLATLSLLAIVAIGFLYNLRLHTLSIARRAPTANAEGAWGLLWRMGALDDVGYWYVAPVAMQFGVDISSDRATLWALVNSPSPNGARLLLRESIRRDAHPELPRASVPPLGANVYAVSELARWIDALRDLSAEREVLAVAAVGASDAAIGESEPLFVIDRESALGVVLRALPLPFSQSYAEFCATVDRVEREAPTERATLTQLRAWLARHDRAVLVLDGYPPFDPRLQR